METPVVLDTPALALARAYRATGQSERLVWDRVELQVTDLGRAVAFWTRIVGLRERGTLPDGGVVLGTRDRALVVLHPGARRPVQRGHAGMYHVAIGVPDQGEFSRSLARFAQGGIRISPVDHTMSKAIYLHDPDGHGIEITHETPERVSHFEQGARGLVIIDSGGRRRSGRDPLDLAAELAQAPRTGVLDPLADGTVLAHLHLHVPAIESAVSFFEAVGFVRNLDLSDFGMADLGAGGPCTHRMAVNVWQGLDVPPAPADSARLLRYTLATADRTVFSTATGVLAKHEGGPSMLQGRDPAGVDAALLFTPRAANTLPDVPRAAG